MLVLRFGPAGVPLRFGSTPVEEAIKRSREELGLEAFEVEFVYGVRMKDEVADRIRKYVSENDVVLSSHAPYYVNLCNPEKFENTKRHLIQSILKTERAGGWITVVHPGFYGKLSKEEAYKVTKDALSRIIEEAKARGLKKAYFGLETMGKPSQFGSLEENISLMEELDNVYLVIDFAHIVARDNVDFSTKENVISFLQKLDSIVPDYLSRIHAHFSGIEYSEKGEKRHLPIEEVDNPSYKAVLEAMVELGVKGTIISESPLIEDDALRMKAFYTSLKKRKRS